MSTLYIGIATQKEIRQRTIDIASGRLIPKETDPKVWFTSLASFAQVLSEDNQALLTAIREHHPESVSALAELLGRGQPSVTRTLKTMESYGIIALKKERTGTVPVVNFDEIDMHMHVRLAA